MSEENADTKTEATRQKTASVTLSVVEAGAMLGLSKSATYRAINRGEIPALRFGRRIVVPIASLQRLINQAASPSDKH